MPTQDAAGKTAREVRTDSTAPRLSQAEAIAYTATNLYALMAWLYDKPRT